MCKKILILTCLLVFIFQFVFISPKEQAKAVGIDTVVKAIGGKAIIRGIAEKLGMTLSKKQLNNVVGYIEHQSYKGDKKAIDFLNGANAVKGTAAESGWKKYLIDPALWLTGADLIFVAIDAFKAGYDNSTPVQTWGMCAVNPIGSQKENFPYFATYVNNGEIFITMWSNPDHSLDYSNPNYLLVVKEPGFWRTYKDSGGGWSFSSENNTGSVGIGYKSSGNPVGLKTYQDDAVCINEVQQGDIINISNVNNNVYNAFKNNTYNTNITYIMDMDIPDSLNYDDTIPWNSPDPKLEKELVPTQPGQEPEDKPSGSSWWEWLLKPLIAAIKAIGDVITGLVTSIGDLLTKLLIPSDGFIDGLFNGLFDDFNLKLPFIGQLADFFGSIKDTTSTEPVIPEFKVTMPDKWGGGTYNIIDFKYFTDYRSWILNFIRFSAWFVFLRRLYNRIPKLIY